MNLIQFLLKIKLILIVLDLEEFKHACCGLAGDVSLCWFKVRSEVMQEE